MDERQLREAIANIIFTRHDGASPEKWAWEMSCDAADRIITMLREKVPGFGADPATHEPSPSGLGPSGEYRG